jgi:hypothetical protein
MQPWRSGFPLAMQITLAGRLSRSMEAFKLKKSGIDYIPLTLAEA